MVSFSTETYYIRHIVHISASACDSFIGSSVTERKQFMSCDFKKFTKTVSVFCNCLLLLVQLPSKYELNYSYWLRIFKHYI
jgi:hypothetical protein